MKMKRFKKQIALFLAVLLTALIPVTMSAQAAVAPELLVDWDDEDGAGAVFIYSPPHSFQTGVGLVLETTNSNNTFFIPARQQGVVQLIYDPMTPPNPTIRLMVLEVKGGQQTVVHTEILTSDMPYFYLPRFPTDGNYKFVFTVLSSGKLYVDTYMYAWHE